tara:strand:+ start:3926 stop:4624 length:699 start_codon:yes stop_codon:yes gene_type:complete
LKKFIFIALALLIGVEVVILAIRFGPSKDKSLAPTQASGPERGMDSGPPSAGTPPTSAPRPPTPNLPPETRGVIRSEFFGVEPLALDLNIPVFKQQEDGRVLKTDVAEQLDGLNDPEREPVEDIQLLTSAVASYRQIFRENPIAGENREVVEALTGNNPYQMMFIDPSHPAINSNNELMDRWKVPYQFHPVSRDQMEIRSAGVDRQFGTADDIMIEEPVQFGNFENFEDNGQ